MMTPLRSGGGVVVTTGMHLWGEGVNLGRFIARSYPSISPLSLMTEPDRFSLSPEDMRRFGYQVVDQLVDHFTGLQKAPVARAPAAPGALRARWGDPVPARGLPPEAVLAQVREEVFGHMAHVDHPRFFAFVPGAGNFVGAMAEALAAGYNVFAGSWAVASGPAEVELALVDWLRAACGLPEEAGGLFTTGGSMANLTALATARSVLLPDGAGGACVYLSDQVHSSNRRALHALGFTEDQVRVLPSDRAYRLSPGALRDAVAADRRVGRRPFCVVASAGTTNTGAVDPLPELAAFCRAEGLWLHADGAYGAPAVFTEAGRAALDGLGLVDSLALDPHKWLFQPFEIGCVLVRERRHLRETFEVEPAYLRDVLRQGEEINFRDYSLQLTRSFRALKLWMSLRIFGRDALVAAIDRGIRHAERAEAAVRGLPDWEVVTPAQIGVVTFRYAPGHLSGAAREALHRRLVEAVRAAGFAMFSTTVLRGETVLRLCTINPRTTAADIDATVAHLDERARALAADVENDASGPM